MANNKTGFNYYNVDTDRYQDIKIKRLKRDYKCRGVAVYDYILCEIYRVRGCFLVWDENTAFDVAEYFGLRESQVNEIVNYCAAVGLFDKELLRCGNILTSRSIQQRFIEMSVRSKRKDAKIPDGINLIIPEESDKLTEESDIIPEQSPIPPEVCGKVKKSKVNNSLYDAREEFPPARICDEPLEKCILELSGNQSWIETFVMNTRSSGYRDFTVENFHEYLHLFFAKLQDEGETSISPKEAMTYFSRWVKIELKKQKDDRTRATNFKPHAKGTSREVVRGEAGTTANMEPSCEAPEDYSSRF